MEQDYRQPRGGADRSQMLSLRNEERTDLEYSGAKQTNQSRTVKASEQEISSNSRNDHVSRDEPFQPVEQPASAAQAIQQDSDPGQGIEELRLYISVNRYPAIHKRVPEWPDMFLHTACNERRERQMKLLNIKWNVRS